VFRASGRFECAHATADGDRRGLEGLAVKAGEFFVE
jgi:hypothetical protein